MKNFIKGRWFPLLLAAAIVLVVSSILYYYGFRITYAPELENNWDAIEACAAWVGAIGTIAVLIYNHIAIELTQKSVRQAVDLQLFEKRLELYNAIGKDTAFDSAPLSLKIAYTVEIYELYAEIAELCEKRWVKIKELAQALERDDILSMAHGNTCYELYELYRRGAEYAINNNIVVYRPDGTRISLENHMANTETLHEEVCKKYCLLEKEMKAYIEQSIKI